MTGLGKLSTAERIAERLRAVIVEEKAQHPSEVVMACALLFELAAHAAARSTEGPPPTSLLAALKSIRTLLDSLKRVMEP